MAGSSSASRLSNAALWLADNSSGNAMTSAGFIRFLPPSYKKIAGIQHRNAGCCTGSATAGDRLGGVRPSWGAAMSERERAPMESNASEQPVLAAPADGRHG